MKVERFLKLALKTLVLAFEYLHLIISNNTLIGLFLNINTKFGPIEKKLFKCDNWSKELFSWMIGKKLCIQMRHLVQ